jgi:cytochrome c oxidase subunit II
MPHTKTKHITDFVRGNKLVFLVAAGIIAGSVIFSYYLNRVTMNGTEKQITTYQPKAYHPAVLQTLLEKNNEYVIIDVRDKREYDRGHLPGAIHADYHDEAALKAAAGDKTPITYCTYSAWRGPYAAYMLYKNGYTNVGVLNGGVNGWNEKIGLLTTEDGDKPFVYPHPEADVIFPQRALQKAEAYEGETSFTITAERFSFTPNRMAVKKGQKVTLTITAADIAHGFALPEYGIAEELLPGQTKTIEFIADRAGTFPYVCSVYCGDDGSPGHNHYSMTGELTVQ